MSVDTHLKGKNLEPYRTERSRDLEILIAPTVRKIASRAVLDVRSGVFGKKLVAVVYLKYPGCAI